MKTEEEKSEDKEITISLKDKEKVEEEGLEEKEINNNQLNKQKNQLKPQQLDLFIINPSFSYGFFNISISQ